MSTDILPLSEFRGSPGACGKAYGQRFATLIMGFIKAEVDPSKSRLGYASKCWKHVAKSAPHAAEIIDGMAEGSGLSREHLTLMSLHEEVYHVPHCTAFAATGEATQDAKTIIGQNWDWAPKLYPWPGLLRLAPDGGLRTATYHYPGLWACAGVNEAGLGLVWTGGGYFPKVKPVVGTPTYVLIAEILQRRTIKEAVGYLASVKQAGCFIFFLGDAEGQTAIVEGVPGRIHVDQSDTAMSRANHYLCKDVLKCGKQVKPSRKKASTLQRAARMEELIEAYRGRMSPEAAEAILTDRGTDWPWVHQFPGGKRAHELAGMTIDSLYVVCQERLLRTCRGGWTPGPWVSVIA